jgi:lipopolysaccharide export system protein LptA
MQMSIQRLRWGLIAGALLLVALLTAYIGYGRYRALQTYTRLLKRSGVSITHETDGFTYSQSVQGKTIFTIHAARAVQHGDGQWTLHDVVMTFYGREPGVTDHVQASEVEYDEKQGIARAQGEVHMDLQAPQALSGTRTEPSKQEDAALIHVRTSGLVYLRKLGVAATDQPVEFRYGGVQCTARGAEFNTSQSTLRLLAEVHLTGEAHGQPLDVTATQADMDRTANIANLTLPVVTSLGRSARADAATLQLRKDGTLERAQAGGNVVLRADTPHAGMREVTAARLDATLNEQTVPRTARLSGGVVLTDSNPLRPMHGSAAQVDASFNEQGVPASVTATGGAKMAMTQAPAPGARGQALARELEAAKIVALFVPAAKGSAKTTAQLRQVTATGSARARGESLTTAAKGVAGGALKSTLVAGDELQLSFEAGARPQPQTLHGSGHTVLQQDAPFAEQQVSTGDTLEMAFAAKPAGKTAATASAAQDEFAITSAQQSGHVSIHDRAATKPGAPSTPGAVSSGGAERAAYDGITQKLTLTGDAHLTGDNASLSAPTVVVDRVGNVAEAFGGVRATLESAPAPGAGPSAKPAAATHVLAASARFEHESKLAVFRGTDAQPARLWQDASQVQAAELSFDGLHHTFSARPAGAGALVHAVFAGAPATDAAKPEKKPDGPATKREGKPAATNLVRVASPKMDYNDVQREAVFSGGVQMNGTLGEVRSQRALVYLTPAPPVGDRKPTAAGASIQPSPMNGSLQRVVVLGGVQLEQPGRRGTGEQLVYTAATDNFVLTGTPEHRPMVVDAQQGSVTGTTLTFGAAGSTIVVAGEPGSTTAKHARVRTETEVRQ